MEEQIEKLSIEVKKELEVTMTKMTSGAIRINVNSAEIKAKYVLMFMHTDGRCEIVQETVKKFGLRLLV